MDTRTDGHVDPPTTRRLRDRLPKFALVMAGLLAIAAFPQSALFALDRVTVTGDTALGPDGVLAITGIRVGDRLFAVDAAGAQRRLRAHPAIKRADLWLRPPRAIGVRIDDRRPVVALVAGGRYAWLGDDLVVVRVTDTTGLLPELVDRTGRSPWVRAGAAVAAPGARVAVDMLPHVPAALRATLRRIEVAAGPDVTLLLASGLEIRVGGPATAAERLATVPDLISALRVRGAVPASIDLRYAGSVAVRLAPGGEVR